MLRPTDLQDNLSKTQAVQKVFQTMQQQPDNQQKGFAQVVKENIEEENETVEQLDETDQLEITTLLDKKTTREEQKKFTKRKKKEKEVERVKSSDNIIDITI